MAENGSQNTTVARIPRAPQVNEQVLIVQVLVGVFLYVNGTLIFTFIKKEVFRTNTRYILFAHTLVCDSLFLLLTNLTLLLSYFRIMFPVGSCIVVWAAMVDLNFATPLTLTAMSLECYVAICMPLRHAEISTPQRAVYSILVIHVISSIQWIVPLLIFVSSVPLNIYSSGDICSAEIFLLQNWHRHVRSGISQFYFLIMSGCILYAYIKIMQAAKMASADNKKSASKGLKTVILHGFQLLLSLIQLWCPFIEQAVLEIDMKLFVNIRYFNYVAFTLASRCLSPLIYGLRDDQFYLAVKQYVMCGLKIKTSPSSFKANANPTSV